MGSKIRVLVVDDSAFVRKIVTQMLLRSDEIDVVGAARDGIDALELVERHSPDVITLDLVMPRMNGVEFIRAQNARTRVPIVICSIANQSGEMALEALELGAVDFVQKPTALATDRVYEIADELVEKVLSAAKSVRRVAPVRAAPAPVRAVRAFSRTSGTQTDVVVLGISTGGPQALRRLIPQLPADFPVPVVMVLHMPLGYTAMYAQRLNAICALSVVEVAHGDVLAPGVVWLAPAGQHLTFVRSPGGEVRAHLDLRPADTQHRPAVDVLFRSAADVFGPRVLGVVMTGMGSDGLLGAAHIKAQGGRIATEAEGSCVVYGMPRVVDEAALSDRSATLEEMANAITELI
ncbi:MAG: chemotaxis response regulator protein-glutamate methylesterase [Gemmatimonadaceae bacterium]